MLIHIYLPILNFICRVHLFLLRSLIDASFKRPMPKISIRCVAYTSGKSMYSGLRRSKIGHIGCFMTSWKTSEIARMFRRWLDYQSKLHIWSTTFLWKHIAINRGFNPKTSSDKHWNEYSQMSKRSGSCWCRTHILWNATTPSHDETYNTNENFNSKSVHTTCVSNTKCVYPNACTQLYMFQHVCMWMHMYRFHWTEATSNEKSKNQHLVLTGIHAVVPSFGCVRLYKTKQHADPNLYAIESLFFTSQAER